MELRRAGTPPSSKGTAECFSGTVQINSLFQAQAPAQTASASVTFEPGARSARRTHPLGQTLIVTSAVMILLTSGVGLAANGVEVTRSESTPSSRGPTENFTGTVRIDSQFQRSDPARVSGALVTFEPRARTAWHTHPLGQTLIVTAGTGWLQHWGGASQQIKEGDVVWIPPGVKHWHGATASERMSHVAIQEALNGKVVEWMEKVSDEQYLPKGTPGQ